MSSTFSKLLHKLRMRTPPFRCLKRWHQATTRTLTQYKHKQTDTTSTTTKHNMKREQDTMLRKMCHTDGFIAALDQSSGSTPKALRLYGIKDDEYEAGEESMYDQIHEMRTRIMTSPKFTGDRILGSILFEDTMRRNIQGIPTAEYLWKEKNIVPFLKVDKGLEEQCEGVQLMRPIPNLNQLCDDAVDHGVFGTKMRSVIREHKADCGAAIQCCQGDIGQRTNPHH